MTVTAPVTKSARHAQIAEILGHQEVRSQEQLAGLLAERGITVTQATLSRDLDELGAVRLRGLRGALVYALPANVGGPGSWPGGIALASGGMPAAEQPGEPAATQEAAPGQATAALSRSAADLLVSAEASANLVVLRTPAGGAQLLASAIDHAGWPSVLGTVAGDDTVLLISRDPAGGAALAQALLRLAERRPEPRRP